jgi:hypothetical protein
MPHTKPAPKPAEVSITDDWCAHCTIVTCEDCRNIASEYKELYQSFKHNLKLAQDELAQVQTELAKVKRERQMYKDVAQAGIGDIISAWMDKEIGQLIEGEQ